VANHGRNAADRFERAQKNSDALIFSFRDDIRTEVHSVREVHIEVPALPKHHFVSFCSPAKGVTGGIHPAQVCLNFDNSSDQDFVTGSPAQKGSEEFLCDR
jgi:hypothetical protein